MSGVSGKAQTQLSNAVDEKTPALVGQESLAQKSGYGELHHRLIDGFLTRGLERSQVRIAESGLKALILYGFTLSWVLV